MRRAIAIVASIFSQGGIQAADLVETPAFKLHVSGDWRLVQSVDPEVRLLYSKELDVGVTASFMFMSAKPSDTERIATKLKEFRLQAENKAAAKLNLRMTIAEPIVVPFSQGHQVAYFGHDNTGRQFRYLGLALPAKNINLYAESKTRSQGELEKVFNQLLNGLSF